MENILPEHIKRSIARHEAAADGMKKKSAALLNSKGDPMEVTATRDLLAEEKFKHQRRVEYILSELGLPPRHMVARRQIEERKAVSKI